MKLNLKRIIDKATEYEGKKQSISRAQMSEARRCIFAAIYEERRRRGIMKRPIEFWFGAVSDQCINDWAAAATKPASVKRRKK